MEYMLCFVWVGFKLFLLGENRTRSSSATKKTENLRTSCRQLGGQAWTSTSLSTSLITSPRPLLLLLLPSRGRSWCCCRRGRCCPWGSPPLPAAAAEDPRVVLDLLPSTDSVQPPATFLRSPPPATPRVCGDRREGSEARSFKRDVTADTVR